MTNASRTQASDRQRVPGTELVRGHGAVANLVADVDEQRALMLVDYGHHVAAHPVVDEALQHRPVSGCVVQLHDGQQTIAHGTGDDGIEPCRSAGRVPHDANGVGPGLGDLGKRSAACEVGPDVHLVNAAQDHLVSTRIVQEAAFDVERADRCRLIGGVDRRIGGVVRLIGGVVRLIGGIHRRCDGILQGSIEGNSRRPSRRRRCDCGAWIRVHDFTWGHAARTERSAESNERERSSHGNVLSYREVRSSLTGATGGPIRSVRLDSCKIRPERKTPASSPAGHAEISARHRLAGNPRA